MLARRGCRGIWGVLYTVAVFLLQQVLLTRTKNQLSQLHHLTIIFGGVLGVSTGAPFSHVIALLTHRGQKLRLGGE